MRTHVSGGQTLVEREPAGQLLSTGLLRERERDRETVRDRETERNRETGRQEDRESGAHIRMTLPIGHNCGQKALNSPVGPTH